MTCPFHGTFDATLIAIYWGRVACLRKFANAVPSNFMFPRWMRRGKRRSDVSCAVPSMVVWSKSLNPVLKIAGL